MKRVKFVSYYTEGTPYEQEVKVLQASLEKFKLDYRIDAVPNLGNWKKNAQFKADYLKRVLDEENCPLFSIDADAVIVKYPELVFELDCDWAAYVHTKPPFEVIGASMFVNNNQVARRLLDEWIEENKIHPEIRGGINFDKVIWNNRGKIHFTALPPSYCKIIDTMEYVTDPVIIQNQASRRYKDML